MAKHSSSNRLISHGHSLYDKYGPSSRSGSSSRALAQVPQLPLFLLLMIALWAAVGCGYVMWRVSRASRPQLPGYLFEPVLISYSYFEKDAIQVRSCKNSSSSSSCWWWWGVNSVSVACLSGCHRAQRLGWLPLRCSV
jgi:hypothetical protein